MLEETKSKKKILQIEDCSSLIWSDVGEPDLALNRLVRLVREEDQGPTLYISVPSIWYSDNS